MVQIGYKGPRDENWGGSLVVFLEDPLAGSTRKVATWTKKGSPNDWDPDGWGPMHKDIMKTGDYDATFKTLAETIGVKIPESKIGTSQITSYGSVNTGCRT